MDAREPHEFAAGHLRGSLNVPADGRFAELAGTVLEPGRPILIVAPDGREEEVVVRLARIGLDTVAGHLPEPEAVFPAMEGELTRASRLTARELRQARGGEVEPVVLDVRNAGELAGGRIDGSLHIPLAELPKRLGQVPAAAPLVVYCAGGTRSSVAASLLRAKGRSDVSDLIGGYGAWSQLLLPAGA